jgi:exodeoxyribonuclease VII small subunit
MVWRTPIPTGRITPVDEPDEPEGDAPRYVDALAELEAILAELEDGDVDIDRLAARVRRAAELVELCRARVDDARVEVVRIVAEIDEVAAAPDEPST